MELLLKKLVMLDSTTSRLLTINLLVSSSVLQMIMVTTLQELTMPSLLAEQTILKLLQNGLNLTVLSIPELKTSEQMVHDSSTLTGTRLLLSALALIVSIRPQLTQVLVPSDSAICHSIHQFKELQTTNIHGEPYSLMKMEHLQERVLAHGLLLTTHITTKPNVR